MSDGLELLQKIIKIRKEKEEEEARKRVRIRTGVDFWGEKFAPIQTTQRTYEKKGFQAYLNKAISSKAYQTMVREGLAPQLQDKNIWGVLASQFGFPLKKVFSAGMAFPRGLSAVYAMTPERKLPWLKAKEYKPGEMVNLRDYISRGDISPVQAFKKSRKEATELYKGYPSSGEVLKEAAKAFLNRPGAVYKDYDWIKALSEKHPESWAAKPWGWAEDTDDWVKGTNWFQKFASGIVGTPFGVAGLTLDIVTDPITYITGGVGKGANMGVKATRDIVSKSGQVVIKKGSPIALRSTARIMLKGGWDDALREGKSAFSLIRNYTRGGLGITDDQAFKAMMKLGVPIKNTKKLGKWTKILGDVPDEAVEGIIRKKITEGLVRNMFGKMDTPMAKSLVDYGGLKIAEKTMIPGYKFQSMEGAMKALQKKPVIGTLSRMFTTGSGIPSEFLPAKAYIESAMRARGAAGAEMIAKMFKGLNKTSVNKIDDFLGYSGDIAKYTKQLDDLYKTPISKIKNWDKHLAKISDLEKYILKLKDKLPKLTSKETVVKNIYKQRFLKDFLQKEELKWGAKYEPLEEYFHPRIVPKSIKGDIRTWGKGVLGAERQPFQYGKEYTWTQLKALQKAGKLKLKTLPESAIKRIAESVTGVGRKQMLNEVKGFGSLTKQPKYIKSTLPELKGWYFPEEIVTPMERTTSAFFGEEAVRTTARVYDKIHLVWKRWALATPGFHLRNFYSDCWSGWMQYGMEYFNPKYWKDAAVIKASGRFKLHKLINIGERGTAYSDDLYRTMTKSGEISGGFYASEALTRRPVERLVSKLDPSIWSTKGGAIREDMGRIVAGLIERNHGSNNMMAAFGVKRVFYDYFDLTKTEKNIMKRLMPFYTWMRKNVARQVELMITRPGKYAAIPKVKTYLESIAEKPEGYETYKPEYFKELQTILTKAKTKEGYPLALWPNLPFGDVSKLGTNLPSEILNSISPILKAPLEILFNRSSFLGNELRLGEYREAPQWIKSSLGHLPNSFLKQIGMEKDEKTGKMVISNLASYLLSQFPPFSTATRLAPADELPKTPYDWLSVMGGIKFFPYQEKREKERYQKQWIEEFKDFSEYKEKLTREETIGLTDIKTGLRFMYDQEVDKKYTDKITEAENLNKMGKLLGGTTGRIFKNRAKKLLEDYYADLDKAKGKDVDKLYELLLEMGMKPDDNDIRQAIKDRLEIKAKEKIEYRAR